MGLDFGIEKKRKGAAYESLDWEDVCWWRNCWNVREVFFDTIQTNDNYEYPLTIGAVQILIKKLSDILQEYNLNELEALDWDDCKLLIAISDLSRMLADHIMDFENGTEWEYRVIDSY